MKLEGSLDAFGLPDIFQLLSYTKKTGGLHLRCGEVDGVVYFAQGSVSGATADGSRQLLARRLVGTGAVGDDELAAAVRRALADGVGVTRALVESGNVDPGAAREAAADQAVEAVFDLLGWAEGDFAFSVDEANPDDLGVELATEQLVAEAARRRQVVDEAGEPVVGPDVVLAMPVTPPTDASLTAEEWALLALADGRRTVSEVAELTGLSAYAVTATLGGMLRRGLLQVSDGSTDHASAVRRRLEMLAPLETAAATAAPAVTQQPSAPLVPAGPSPASAAPAADERGPGEVVRTLVATIGGPHVPDDVVPTRPEPFLPARQPEHPESTPARASAGTPAPPVMSGPGSGPASTPVPPHPAAPSPRPVFDAPRPPDPVRPVTAAAASVGEVHGSAAMAPDPEAAAVIERDPSVNRSLLLRLIAGVRGL